MSRFFKNMLWPTEETTFREGMTVFSLLASEEAKGIYIVLITKPNMTDFYIAYSSIIMTISADDTPDVLE